MDIQTVSRSAIETRQKCTRERYLSQNYQQKGLTQSGLTLRGGRYETFFGQTLHDLVAIALTKPGDLRAISEAYRRLDDFIVENFAQLPEDHLKHFRAEQRWLAMFLFEGWAKFRLPQILASYRVVSVEKEHTVFLNPKDYLPSGMVDTVRPLKIPVRMDCVLEDIDNGNYYIMDLKTCRQASKEWNLNLDNSLQSHLYVEAAQQLYPDNYIAGIFYEGLVKGYREMDNALSSSFKGQVIQYGSPLYGWKDASGKVSKDYVKGRRRVFTPEYAPADFLTYFKEIGFDVEKFFPTTIPWKPLDTARIIGSTLANENVYTNNLEYITDYPESDPVRQYYEDVLFEPNLTNCYKYGNKHPCQFVQICHNRMSREEIAETYEARKDHHAAEGDIA